MLRKHNAISDNPFIHEPSDSIILNLMNSIFDDMFYNTENELGHLKNYSYVYALLGYGDWSTEPDVFQYVDKKCLKTIRKKETFFIFDASLEGFSPTGMYAIFDYLHKSCKTHKIDPGMIIYITGNLKDEKNMKNWVNANNQNPFNIVTHIAFEAITLDNQEARHKNSRDILSTSDLIRKAVRGCKKKFKDKYFSSLSRVNRHERTNATFMLCKHSVSSYALISHNVLDNERTEDLKQWGKKNGYNEKDITNWIEDLPLIVDYDNFEVNWATQQPWGHIFDQTIFQLTNETLVDNVNNTSLFYSEKTFKPMLKFQPFVIYGQPGCNHALSQYGYKLYNDWFDLSFDFEEDNTLRYKKLLESVEKACRHLDTLSRDEKIQWRFKNIQVLQHNCNVLKNSTYSKNKLYQFFKNLKANVS